MPKGHIPWERRMKKRILVVLKVLVCVLVSNGSAFAQKEKSQVVITVGAAYSLTGAIIKTVLDVGGTFTSYRSTTLPIGINGMIDFGVSEKFSLGLAYTRQTWNAQYENYVFEGNVIPSFDATLSRTNYAFRTLFHFGEREKFDWYWGVRTGLSYWKINSNSNDPDYKVLLNRVTFSPQALFGTRYYISENFGIGSEIGIGSPYVLSLNLNGKF